MITIHVNEAPAGMTEDSEARIVKLEQTVEELTTAFEMLVTKLLKDQGFWSVIQVKDYIIAYTTPPAHA